MWWSGRAPVHEALLLPGYLQSPSDCGNSEAASTVWDRRWQAPK